MLTMLSNYFKKIASSVHSLSATTQQQYQDILDLPQELISELHNLEAFVDIPPTRGPLLPKGPHDTLLVEPNPDRGYILRANIKVKGYVLHSKLAFNFNPPVLYVSAEKKLSSQLQSYLDQNCCHSFFYNTDEHHFRQIVPTSESNKSILMVGDSVCFGCLVSDDESAPSAFQRLVGSDYSVINAGVGGYSSIEVVKAATSISESRNFDRLIYIACQNDFMIGIGYKEDPILVAKRACENFAKIAERFAQPTIICLHTYMEYNIRHLFAQEGWGEKSLRDTLRLREELPSICASYGILFVDWTTEVEKFVETARTPYAAFGLYIDHCHLSPLGNELLAQQLFAAINKTSNISKDYSIRSSL